MLSYYRIFGMVLRSDRELPGLIRINETSEVDYSLLFDRVEKFRDEFGPPAYISPLQVKNGRAVVETAETEQRTHLLFRFHDAVEFIVGRQCREIWVNVGRRISLQTVAYHLLYSMTGFLLCLRDSVCLHGAAIGTGKGAIALLGTSNAGKSVISASLAARGLEVLSDDLVSLDVLDTSIQVYPGYPWISLRTESLHLLKFVNTEALQFSSRWKYLDEGYVSWDLCRRSISRSGARTLMAIYFLKPVDDAESVVAITNVPQVQAFMKLLDSARRTHIPYRDFVPIEFSLLGAVSAAVPAYEVCYHLTANSLATVSDVLAQAPESRSARDAEMVA